MPIHIGLTHIDCRMKDRTVLILFSAAAVLMAAGIHITQAFRFFNVESVNLFIYDGSDVLDRLLHPGGLALVLSSFLTQFMCVPFVGTLITTLLYLTAGFLTFRIISGTEQGPVMAGLSFIPVAFLFLCLENDYYMYHGHVAFILALAAVLVYASLPQEKPAIRYLIGVLLVPLLYHALGSAATVFAVSVFVLEIIRSGFRGLAAAVYPLILLMTAWIYVRLSLADGWDSALTPFMYYSNPSTYFFPLYAWCSVPLLLAASKIVSYMHLNPKASVAVAAAGLVCSFFLAGNLYGKIHSEVHYRLIQEQHLAEQGEWDEIIRTADRRHPTFFISYMNLALAQKGTLVGRFANYNPQDLSSLMYPIKNLKTGFTLQSTVYESWGYHAAARQAAFDANLVTPGMRNPRQLMVLVRTNIALGAYDVAEKYIRVLEKTLFYRKWAKDASAALDHPSTVLLPSQDEYLRYDGLKGDMRDMLQADPSQPILSQFYELYGILEGAK